MINKKRSFSSRPAPKKGTSYKRKEKPATSSSGKSYKSDDSYKSSKFSDKKTFKPGRPSKSGERFYDEKPSFGSRFSDKKDFRANKSGGRSFESDETSRPSRFSDRDDSRTERSFKPRGRSYESDDFKKPSRFADKGYDAERPSRFSDRDDSRTERSFKPRGRSYESDDFKKPSRFADKKGYDNDRPSKPAKRSYDSDESYDLEDFDKPLSFADKKKFASEKFADEYSSSEKGYKSTKSSSRSSRYDKKPVAAPTAAPDKRFNEMIFGAHALIEVLKAKKRKIVQIYTTKPTPRSWERVQPYMPAYPIQIQYVDVSVLDRMANTHDHMGIIAWVTPFKFRSKMFDPKKAPFIVLLDAVQDVRNLGAILRSASCIGVSGVVLCKSMAAPLTGAAFKASAGLAEHLDIYIAPSLKAAVQDIKQAGYHMYLAVLENGEDATGIAFKHPGCLVIGNEASGITKEIRSQGTLVTLPQRVPDVSFNASVAAGILMFLMAHQTK